MDKNFGLGLGIALILLFLAVIAISYNMKTGTNFHTNGTSNTTANVTVEKAHYGTYFNGHTYMLLNHSVSGNFSASVWMDYTGFNGTGVAISQGVGEGSHSVWYIGDGGEIDNSTYCGIFSDQRVAGNATAGWVFATMPFIKIGKWHNIVCVYNLSYVSIYLDGSFVDKTATPYKIYNSSIIEIGKRTSTFYINGTIPTSAFFTGNMANIQIYDYVLSASEIMKIYQEGINGMALSNVTIYLPLRQNDSTCAYMGRPCTFGVIR